MAQVNIDENIFDILNQGVDGEPLGTSEDEKTAQAVEQLTTLLTWGATSVQDIANDAGFPGFGKMKPEQVAELGGIVAKRRASGFVMENSPELTLGGILLGVAFSNILHYRKMQLQESKKEQKGENE